MKKCTENYRFKFYLLPTTQLQLNNQESQCVKSTLKYGGIGIYSGFPLSVGIILAINGSLAVDDLAVSSVSVI